jgi:predicted transcriptional regulator
MFREINTVEEFETFFNVFTPQKLKLLFLMKDWKAIADLTNKTGLSRGGITYHLDLLEKEGMIDSRLIKWKTTYRKEYKTKPLVLQVNFVGK